MFDKFLSVNISFYSLSFVSVEKMYLDGSCSSLRP